jgi:hypothetical protein
MEADQRRAALIEILECTAEFAELVGEPTVAYLIERALDEARSRQVAPTAAIGQMH